MKDKRTLGASACYSMRKTKHHLSNKFWMETYNLNLIRRNDKRNSKRRTFYSFKKDFSFIRNIQNR